MQPTPVLGVITPELVSGLASLCGKTVDPVLSQLLAQGGNYALEQWRHQPPQCQLQPQYQPNLFGFATFPPSQTPKYVPQGTPYKPARLRRRRPQTNQPIAVALPATPLDSVNMLVKTVPGSLESRNGVVGEKAADDKKEVTSQAPILVPGNFGKRLKAMRDCITSDPLTQDDDTSIPIHVMRTGSDDKAATNTVIAGDIQLVPRPVFERSAAAKKMLRQSIRAALSEKVKSLTGAEEIMEFMNDAMVVAFMLQLNINCKYKSGFIVYVASNDFYETEQMPERYENVDNLYYLAINILAERIIGPDGDYIECMSLEDMLALPKAAGALGQKFQLARGPIPNTRKAIRTHLSEIVIKHQSVGTFVSNLLDDAIIGRYASQLNIFQPHTFIIYAASDDFCTTETMPQYYFMNALDGLKCYQVAIAILADKVHRANGEPVKSLSLDAIKKLSKDQCNSGKLITLDDEKVLSASERDTIRGRVAQLLQMMHCKTCPIPTEAINPALDACKTQLNISIGDGSREHFIIFAASDMYDGVWDCGYHPIQVSLYFNCPEQSVRCYDLAVKILTEGRSPMSTSEMINATR